MNNNPSPTELQPESSGPQPPAWTRYLSLRWVLPIGILVLAIPAIFLVWFWLKEPPRSPALLAGDRQRMKAFLAAHDYEAFVRLMELQPPATRLELPAEWQRRYDEIKPALLFTVREASTEDVIDSEENYEAPLLSLRWSSDGKYLVDVLEQQWNPKAHEKPSKVFDGRTGRLVLTAEQPPLLPETEAHWPLGQWKKPKSVNDQFVNRLCFSFGHDPAYWQAQKQRPVLLMPSPDNRRMLTGYAVNPSHVMGWKNLLKDALGRPMWTFSEDWEQKVAASRRCFNVWRAASFPE